MALKNLYSGVLSWRQALAMAAVGAALVFCASIVLGGEGEDDDLDDAEPVAIKTPVPFEHARRGGEPMYRIATLDLITGARFATWTRSRNACWAAIEGAVARWDARANDLLASCTSEQGDLVVKLDIGPGGMPRIVDGLGRVRNFTASVPVTRRGGA